MEIQLTHLSLVVFCAAAVFVTLLFQTRGITFINASRVTDGRLGMTDQERQVRAAASLKGFGWPSRMHHLGGGKARMKDVGVLGLALFQRLLRDTRSAYPLAAFCNFCTCACAVILYLVATLYWNPTVGLFLSLFYLFCLWPHQITLSGGYHTLAQLLFLAAVFVLQLVPLFPDAALVLFLVSGVAIGLMMFASASGRKFLFLYLGAFLWSLRSMIQPALPNLTDVGALLFFWAGVLAVFYLAYPPLISAIYKGRGPAVFGRLLQSREKYPLSRYLAWRKKIFTGVAGLSGALVFYAILCRGLSHNPFFYFAHIFILAGFGSVFLTLTLPNVFQNTRGYFVYWYTPKNSCHFLIYRDFFEKIGQPISKEMRGAGLRWVWKCFLAIVPFHSFLFATIWALMMVKISAVVWFGVLFLSLSPILYGELTKSPQFARPYFPGLLGLFVAIGFGLHQMESLFPPAMKIFFWKISFLYLGASALWNAFVFFSDVLPARMAPAYLQKALRPLKPTVVYTYDTPYNDAFLNALPEQVLQKWNVRSIRSLGELNEGYVAIPGTSSKSLNIESYEEGVRGQDFNDDPALTPLIDSRQIRDLAVASFKTLGSSRIWALDSEMPSHRELILKDISEYDRWRGRAWLLKVKHEDGLHRTLA